ncbi:MAG TPA: hypothetical protein VM165_23280, partial [Planctomycetaceae bacterium]|nr:hypothetical protein [Planctomycetaceae bacterium]
ARRALEQIPLVDAAADIAAGLEQAEHASRQASELPAKRVVLWSDLQTNGWADIDWPAWSQRLPDVQIAPLVDQPASNLAVTAVTLEDGFAGTESPGRFLVRVAASASLAAPVPVEVLLSLDDISVGSQLLELSPGQTREVEFQHQFDVAGEPGRPNWVTASAELKPADPESDQLSADNRLSVTVPVVDTVPVVFVDQYGADSEDVSRNRIGETHALRHLLAPKASSTDLARRTVQIQHVTPDEVTQQLLETARLVVVGGVESPGDLVPLLREYVTQGGPLVLLAGGDFDPARWQAEAWRDGRGLLPAPLKSEPVGSLPESTAELHPFFADFRTMQNDLFLVEGEDPETLRGLFETLPFFQAVQFDMKKDVEALATDTTDDDEPKWWLWRTTARSTESSQHDSRRVLAMFSDGRTPWVIEHRIGRGRVVWFASGVSSDWNLLRTSGAMYVFHRLMSRLMSDTLPARNFTTGDRIAFALPAGEASRYQLTRPAGLTEALPTEAIDADVTGVWVRRPVTAGPYRIAAGVVSNGPTESASDVRFCVQAPASESDLTMLSPEALRTQLGNGTARVLEVDELPRVTGGALRGQSLWRWLLAAMLAALLLEMAILAAPAWRKGAA